MVCTVTITSVIGTLPPGFTVPTGIRVTGSVVGCATGSMKVTVDCGGTPMTLSVPISATGDWTAAFTSASNCVCSKPISVTASCSNGECEATLDAPLQCVVVQSGCPTLGSLTISVDGCADGIGLSATAVLTLNLVPPTSGCTYLWHFGDGSPNETTTVPTVTHLYSAPGSFSALVVATCPPAGAGPCIVRAPGTVTVLPCNACPTVVGLTAAVGGCAGPGLATVTFSGALAPPLTGCSFLWAFGDGATLVTTTPSASHTYAAPMTYAVAVTAICPGSTPCATTTIAITVPRCCPIVTNILHNLEDDDCAGSGALATVNFSTVTDPTPALGKYTWDFGDGAPTVTNPGPNATHDYALPGTYTVQVLYTPDPAMYPGCPSSMFSIATVMVPACGTTPPPGPDTGGEGKGCFILRAIMTIAAILAIVSVSLAACIPAATTALLWLALGFGLLAAIAALFWNFLCPKPCAWGLLLAWQVSLGVGFILLYFTVCCPVFWWIGFGLVAAGIALMLLWKKRCKKSTCAVLKELVVALVGVVLPILGWVGAIPVLTACINSYVAGVLSTLASLATLAAASCIP